jgi:hypothetical protein
MELIEDACNMQTCHSAARHRIAHRLRLAEMRENQNGSEEVQALRKELKKAEETLHETLVMIDALKELIVKVSATSSQGERSIDFDRASNCSSSIISSNHSL